MPAITRVNVTAALDAMLEKRLLILDGAMGTMIQRRKLQEADFRGDRFAAHPHDLKGNSDVLVLTRPDVIGDIHREYLDAGADIIETNSFNAQAVSQADYALEPYVYEINVAAARVARAAADEWTARTPGQPRFVAGSIGPANRTLSISPDINNPALRAITFDQLKNAYADQVRGLIDGGADLLLLETIFDTLNAKAGLVAIDEVSEERGVRLPLMISVTITDRSGRTLSGQTLEAFYISIEHARPWSVGLNCALGAREMRPHLAELARLTDAWVSVYPNAGLPNAFGEYDELPAETAGLLREFAESGLVNIIGGCCGTTPDHIRASARAVEGIVPRRRGELRSSNFEVRTSFTRLSGLEPLTIRPDSNFQMIGERTNVTGSRRFARLIKNDDFAGAAAVALEQVRGGANVVDVNMDEGMLDSEQAMTTFLNYIATEPEIARVPVMIDSSKWSVIEAGLKCVQGKPVVNSISLKEGEADFLHKAALVRRYGAAVVVMAFDEHGQADTIERKVAICRRAYRLLTEVAGFDPSDIIFDPNVLAIATGLEEHAAYAINFIEATRLIKASCPGVKISGGISNLSFSFRGNDIVREAMHAAFLYHAIEAGLDMGIVNAGQLAVYQDIPAGPARARRGRAVQPASGCDRTPRGVCRTGEGRRHAPRAGSRLAREARGGAAGLRARARHGRFHRGGHRRGAAETAAAARRHRRPADGRHEDRRRPVRRRQDVPAAGRQERARDETRGRVSRAVHGGREGRGVRRSRQPARRRTRDQRPRAPRHRQGRRP